jgi:hypothetical protein
MPRTGTRRVKRRHCYPPDILFGHDAGHRLHVLDGGVPGLDGALAEVVFLDAQAEEEAPHMVIGIRHQNRPLAAAAFPRALQAAGRGCTVMRAIDCRPTLTTIYASAGCPVDEPNK